MNFTPSSEYKSKYKESINDSNKFWLKESNRLDWIKNPTIAKNSSFEGDVSIKWFEDGKLNACYNCVDRHVKNGKGNDIAIIWEADDPKTESKSITYNDLLKEVSIFANILERNGINKGDRVIIYMPMILEAAIAMLSCSRIGAIHIVVFGGFSSNALSDRIENCNPSLIITADEGIRGGKIVKLKENVDEALKIINKDVKTLIIQNTSSKIKIYDRDIWYHEEKKLVSDVHDNISIQNSEDPLFILHTSGSTGKPKGILHTIGGYLLYSAITFEYAFDYKKGDIFWCSADIGWITGHSYLIYGPLLNGATTVMFEGVPNYPDPSRFWQIIDKYKVNIFYTAPTAIRALMKEGDDYVKNTSRKSLKILGSVGEPINPAAWNWYNEIVGNSKCKIVDTWWQTETGGHMIAPLPNHIKAKPSYASLPFFGVEPVILDNNGNEIKNSSQGNLCIKNSWPGQARSIYGDHKRFKKEYFSKFKGLYCTGDGAKRDEDGYYRITGRIDDVLNIAGHRIGTAEIEAALNKHEKICESSIVGIPHDIKGEAIYAFVILNKGEEPSLELEMSLRKLVRKEIGPIINLDIIHFAEDLPKTRSGKIMRRILRKIANNDYENFGDLSSLTNPNIINKLINYKYE